MEPDSRIGLPCDEPDRGQVSIIASDIIFITQLYR